jgi:hypothetical protein
MTVVDRGNGVPVVLVPGIQGRWEWMAPAVDALASRCRVITFSLADEPSAQCPARATASTPTWIKVGQLDARDSSARSSAACHAAGWWRRSRVALQSVAGLALVPAIPVVAHPTRGQVLHAEPEPAAAALPAGGAAVVSRDRGRQRRLVARHVGGGATGRAIAGALSRSGTDGATRSYCGDAPVDGRLLNVPVLFAPAKPD